MTAQNGIHDVQSMVIPQSPDVASIGKYGEFPVSLNTGNPNISIPIYTIKGNEINLDISISYHGSGIKVAEVASWVGLGWTLNAGGAITRNINILPDEANNGYFNKQSYFLDNFTSGGGLVTFEESTEESTFFTNAIAGIIDLKPDEYYFNFGNYSGKILFDYNKKPSIYPYTDLKIVKTWDATDGWEITTPDGTKYVFKSGDCEKTTIPTSTILFPSAWYLSQIISKSGNEIIDFVYVNNAVSWTPYPKYNRSAEVDKNGAQGECNNLTLPTQNIEVVSQDTKYLTLIRYLKNGISQLSVNFQSLSGDNVSRKDIDGGNRTRRLTKIKIQSHVSDFNTEFDINNDSYFSSGDDYSEKRLKLESIEESGKPEYSFDYNDTPMPEYESFNIDHWGYYNGATNNSYFPDPYDIYGNYYQIASYAKANRETNENYSKACILNKITFPTGGYTMFYWESNRTPLEDKFFFTDFTHITWSGAGNHDDSGFANQIRAYFEELSDDVTSPCESSVNVHVSPVFHPEPGYAYITTNISEGLACGEYVGARLYSVIEGPNGAFILSDTFDDITGSGGEGVYLDGESYVIVSFIPEELDDKNITTTVRYKKHEVLSTLVGGLRIKEINNYDGIGPVPVTTKNYFYVKDFEKETEESSLKLFVEPNHFYQTNCVNSLSISSGIVDSDGNPSPLGNHYGYSEVVEQVLGENAGFTVYKYKNSNYSPTRSTILAQNRYYSDRTKIAKRDTFEYVSVPIAGYNPVYSTNIIAKKVERLEVSPGTGVFYPDVITYNIQSTSSTPTWLALITKKEELFSGENFDKKLENITEYEYAGANNNFEPLVHLNPTKITKYKSDGTKEITRNIYPLDYKISGCENTAEECVETRFTDINDCRSEKFMCEDEVQLECLNEFKQYLSANDYAGLLEDFENCTSKWQNFPASFGICSSLIPGNVAFLDCCNKNYGNHASEIYKQGWKIYKDCIISGLAECKQDYTECFNEANVDCEDNYEQSINNFNSSVDNVNAIYTLRDYHLNNVIESYTKNENEETINAIFNKYKIENNVPLINSVLKIESIDLLNDFTDSESSVSTLNIDSRYKEKIIFDEYDSYNNTLQYHKPDNINTSFIWGYNHTLPVAKIENATYTDVSDKINIDAIQSLDGDALRNALAVLRTELPDALVTMYTYKPLVGIETTTDPNGKTSYYEYDSFNRLKLIRDNNNNILKKYVYRIQAEIKPPSGFGAVDIQSQQINLEWDEIIEAKYNLYIVGQNGKELIYSGEQSSFTHTDLSPNLYYDYNLECLIDGIGSSPASLQLRTKMLPPETTNLSLSCSNSSSVQLSWDNVENEEGYKVYQGTGNFPIATLDADTTSYTDTVLSGGHTYNYWVVAYNTDHSVPSEEISITTIPNAPILSNASPNSDTRIDITWSNIQGETGYKIYVGSLDPITIDPDDNSYTITGLSPNTNYSINITAFNATGESIYSNQLNCNTMLARPGKPDLSLSCTNSSVQLSWDDVANEEGYHIHRIDVENGSIDLIQSVSGGTTSFTDSQTGSGKTYEYGIVAYNIDYSTPSTRKSITTAPSGIGLISGNTSPCQNTNQVYSIAEVAGASLYEWVIPSGWVINSGQDSRIINVSTGTSTGNHSISVRAVNSCGQTNYASVPITINSSQLSRPGPILGPSSVYQGTNVVFSIWAVPNATSYSWTVPTGCTITSGYGTTQVTVHWGNSPGTISVKAQNCNGLSLPSSKNIIIGQAE